MFFSFCLIILSHQLSVAQSVSINTPKYQLAGIKAYTISDGLPSKNTTATIKDSRGFIWVGTENGLCRFDGFNFKVFSSKTGDRNTLTNNYINALCEDRNGKIWIATMDGLNLFDPLSETFQRFFHNDSQPGSLSNNKVWAILCDKAGVVWIGTDDGFNRYLPSKKEFLVYRPNAAAAGSMLGKSVNAIIEDKDSNLWLGNWSGGLNKFNKKTSTFINFLQYHNPGEKNPNDIWALSYASNGSIWVGTYWAGLFNFDPKTSKFLKVEAVDQKMHSVFSITNIDNESILVGGSNGFYFYNIVSKDWKKVGDIKNYDYSSSYKDKDGIIWMNAKDGFFKIENKQYKFHLNPWQLGNRGIRSVVIDKAIVWLGTDNGLFKLDRNAGTFKIFTQGVDGAGLTNNNISKLYLDREGTLWVLTENGFFNYDKNQNRFVHHYHHSVLGNLFNEDVFRDILEIEKGIYVLATDAGIKIYDSNKNQFTHYYNQQNNPLSLNNNHTYNLAMAPDGKIWIGTYGGGINIFNRQNGQFESIKTQASNIKGLSNNVINAIYTDLKKNIWVCTPDGLNKYDAHQRHFLVYAKRDGFSSNIFKEIAEDNDGTIWLTTENGISSFNPSRKLIRNYDEFDGASVNSVVTASGRSVFVAGNKGYLSFIPQQIKTNNKAVSVYLIDFQVFNKTVLPNAGGALRENLNTAKEITLNYDQSVFSLEFVALNYIYPSKNEYAYRLVGFDKKWNFIGNQRKAIYTNLNPGTYQFQVKASNNDGVWNQQVTTINIKINPPWYLSWWAYFCYAGLLVLGVYLYIYYRRGQEKLKYELRIMHIESEKEKELNERKLSFFTNISHEFRTPLTLIINPVKDLLEQAEGNADIGSMNIVYRNAKRLLSLVDQLLLFRKADAQLDALQVSKLNVVALIKEVFLCFSNQAKTNKINYDFHADADFIEIYADQEKLEIAIFNILSNAFKFTPHNGNIGITITENETRVLIEIADSGCGIPTQSIEKIFNRFYQEPVQSKSLGSGFGIGLFLVKNFIDMHSGTINCQSDGFSGTSFYVELLKGKKHFEAGSIVSYQEERSSFLNELKQNDQELSAVKRKELTPVDALSEEKKTILIIDDNEEIANYLSEMFAKQYHILQAWDGETGLTIIRDLLPDVVISDVVMNGMGGVELCRTVKKDESICHIPVVLLTASTSSEVKLEGIESGADDFISKPFDKELLNARIASILKSKNSLQKYFYSEITLNPSSSKISPAYKDFLKSCIRIVEQHIDNPDFNIQILADEIGMSRPNLFNKIKSISGHSSNSFIRFIRLRKAAEIFISTDNTILQTMYMVGINDIKYFRAQFKKIFEMNPSDYIKKYRNTFSKNISLGQEIRKSKK
ncbi:hybrid sensor histidine kinase/response regulator [Pedobacter sp. WC2501]|uniref:hybrid sensor histidine kinase/response regulator n=1 Tax=Pedobacter sp. WC2501 TaxID=3461400 RepID=UPI0040466966